MGYKNADKVLPAELLKLVQQYVEGDYLYIPRMENQRKSWGENTNIREELQERNRNIYQDYLSGMKKGELTEKYYLSIKSIERIIKHMNRTA